MSNGRELLTRCRDIVQTGNLLSDGGRDSRDKVDGIQVQIVTKNLCESLRCNELL